jgi:hypothetical protein
MKVLISNLIINILLMFNNNLIHLKIYLKLQFS